MPMRYLGGLTSSQVTNILMNTIPPELQADAILNQAAPVQNTWYTVLATTTNVRVLNIACMIQTTGETLEIELTIDGRVFIVDGINPGANIEAFLYSGIDATMATAFDYQTIGITPEIHPFFFECRSLKVRARKTTANGVGNLLCGVNYQKW